MIDMMVVLIGGGLKGAGLLQQKSESIISDGV